MYTEPTIPNRRPARTRRVRRTPMLGAVLGLGLALSACGGGDRVASGDTAAAVAGSKSATTGTSNAPKESTMSKPTVSVPTGEAPSSLVAEDLTVGTGAEAVKGKTVFVHYVGVHFTDGSQFDASWDRGEPFSFRLGGGQVIAGWDQGVQGMKVGGRRQLVIPGNLAYGPRGFPPVIQPNETLVFVVDLLDVR